MSTMKTIDQLVTPEVIEILSCHSQGLNSLTEAIMQLAELDVGVVDITPQQKHDSWQVYSISDTYKVDFVNEIYAPQFEVLVLFGGAR